MSHIVSIKTEVRDAAAVGAACQRLKLPPPEDGTHRLFSGNRQGLAVKLNDWHYPAVCNTETGEIAYDNYKGEWGPIAHLHAFLQAYAVEKAKIEARRKGHACTEQKLEDGSIKVIVQVAGGAA